MPIRRPRLTPSESTSAPCSRATLAVRSVEPSSTTSTSTSGKRTWRASSTAGRFASSFHAGMKTTVSATQPPSELGARREQLDGDERQCGQLPRERTERRPHAHDVVAHRDALTPIEKVEDQTHADEVYRRAQHDRGRDP